MSKNKGKVCDTFPNIWQVLVCIVFVLCCCCMGLNNFRVELSFFPVSNNNRTSFMTVISSNAVWEFPKFLLPFLLGLTTFLKEAKAVFCYLAFWSTLWFKKRCKRSHSYFLMPFTKLVCKWIPSFRRYLDNIFDFLKRFWFSQISI